MSFQLIFRIFLCHLWCAASSFFVLDTLMDHVSALRIRTGKFSDAFWCQWVMVWIWYGIGDLFVWLTWLVPCCCPWNIGHRPLVSIQLCLVLPPPSSSSCTCILLSTFLSPDLFSKYSLVVLFLCGLVVFTVAPVWWCCHHFFLTCPSQFHFLLRVWSSTGPEQSFSLDLFIYLWIYLWFTYSKDVDFEELARCTDDFNGAQCKAVCVEAVSCCCLLTYLLLIIHL